MQKESQQFSEENVTLSKVTESLETLVELKEKEMREIIEQFSEERQKMTLEIEENKEAPRKAENLLVQKEKEFASSTAGLEKRFQAEKVETPTAVQLSVSVESPVRAL